MCEQKRAAAVDEAEGGGGGGGGRRGGTAATAACCSPLCAASSARTCCPAARRAVRAASACSARVPPGPMRTSGANLFHNNNNKKRLEVLRRRHTKEPVGASPSWAAAAAPVNFARTLVVRNNFCIFAALATGKANERLSVCQSRRASISTKEKHIFPCNVDHLGRALVRAESASQPARRDQCVPVAKPDKAADSKSQLAGSSTCAEPASIFSLPTTRRANEQVAGARSKLASECACVRACALALVHPSNLHSVCVLAYVASCSGGERSARKSLNQAAIGAHE